MGFFSWKTSDTGKSIANQYSTRETFPVHMITEDGQIFTENSYDGYGHFGGKDVYVLLAEMNGYKGDTDEETRMLFFDKIWRRGITLGNKTYYHREHFGRYDEVIQEEKLSANDLIEKRGWKGFGDSGEFGEWAEQGLKMVKFVERLPSTNKWKEEWNVLPYPESCPDQGFFYDDEEDYEDED